MFSRTLLRVKAVKRMHGHLSVPNEGYKRYSQKNRRTCWAASSKTSEVSCRQAERQQGGMSNEECYTAVQ